VSSDVPPVISKLYDLILWLLNQIPKFPRSHRFVLGDRIETLVLEILELLIEAAYTRNKTAQLKRAGIQLEKVRYLIRMSKDLKLLSLRQYQFVSEQIDELGRMVGGWLRQQEGR
jgi:hypothetical protein